MAGSSRMSAAMISVVFTAGILADAKRPVYRREASASTKTRPCPSRGRNAVRRTGSDPLIADLWRPLTEDAWLTLAFRLLT
jgi:hypothetical protein